MTNKCAVYGCKKPIEIKLHKLCRGHYMRYRSKGEPGSAYIPRKTRLKVYQPDENKMEAQKENL
jgi:hypothetical protein